MSKYAKLRQLEAEFDVDNDDGLITIFMPHQDADDSMGKIAIVASGNFSTLEKRSAIIIAIQSILEDYKAALDTCDCRDCVKDRAHIASAINCLGETRAIRLTTSFQMRHSKSESMQ